MSSAEQVCGRPPADLSGSDASRLIDLLKAVKDGTLDLQAAMENATESESGTPRSSLMSNCIHPHH